MSNYVVSSLLLNSRAGVCSRALDQVSHSRCAEPLDRNNYAGFAKPGQRDATRDISWLSKRCLGALMVCSLVVTVGTAVLT